MEPNNKKNPMDPDLYRAASTGNIKILEWHIHNARCLSGVTYAGDTALHVAARFGHVVVARRICREKPDLMTSPNAKYETPLHYAAKAGKRQLVTLFIELARANNNLGELLLQENKIGETALYQSVLHSHAEIVQILLHAGADLPISPLASIPDDNKLSPLYLATMKGQLAIVTSLIGSLGDNAPEEAYAGPKGQTVLHAAAVLLRTEDKTTEGVFRSVIQWKPDLATHQDESKSTPLHYAVQVGNMKAVRMILLRDRECAYEPNSSGLFPVHIAAIEGFVEVVAELFKQFPDSDQLLDKYGRNFVHIAVETKDEPMVQWICGKLELAEAMNAQDYNGDTAMHLAVRVRDMNIFARLLETGRANLCVMNKDGRTPRDLASAIKMERVGCDHGQNPENKIHEILNLMGNYRSVLHYFPSEHEQSDQEIKEEEDKSSAETAKNIETEDNRHAEMAKDIEKEDRVVETAKNIVTGSTLIASAAFAAVFTIIAAYQSDISARYKSPAINVAFKSSILIVAYSFFCSITATALLIESSLTFLDRTYRADYTLASSSLVNKATKGLVSAFVIGVYVLLTPFYKWLAIVVCFGGAVVVFLMEPYYLPNLLVTRVLIRKFEWRQLFREWKLLESNIYFVSIVLVTILGSSLPPSRYDFIVWFLVILLITFDLRYEIPPLRIILGKLGSIFWFFVCGIRRWFN